MTPNGRDYENKKQFVVMDLKEKKINFMAKETQKARRVRRRPNARARLILLFLAVCVVAAIVFAVVKGSSGVSLSPEPLPFSQSNSYAFTSKGVVYINETVMYYNDMERGKDNWHYDLSLEGLKVAASDSMIAVYSEDAVQVILPHEQISSNKIEFSSTVLRVECGKAHLAVMTSDAQNNYFLTVIGLDGVQQEPIAYDDHYVSAFAFYGEDDKLWTLSNNIDAVIPVSTISTYNAGQSITRVIPIIGELIDDVFIGYQGLYAMGTSNLFGYDDKGHEELRYMTYGWALLDSATIERNNYFLLVPLQSASTPSGKTLEAKLITLPSTMDEKHFRLPEHCLNAFLYPDKIVAVTSNRVYIMDLSGQVMRDYSLEGEFVAVEKISGERLLLDDGQQKFVVPIR